VSPARALFDFRTAGSELGWFTVDDVVMGGASHSTFRRVAPDRCAFAGELSLDHGGGFASLRSPDALAGLAGFEGIELELCGDGRTYKLNLRLDGDFDGIVYQRAFPAPAGARSRVRIPFGEFEATYRGRPVRAAPFAPDRVRSVGFVLADGRAGPFRLELGRVGAWGASEDA
jgi:monofunctional biosynthetic peptidoglycan transglycosylase